MSTDPKIKPIVPEVQPPNQPAQTQPANAPAVDNQGGLDTAFTTPESGAAAQGATTTDNLFDVDTNAGTDALMQQQNAVNATITKARDDYSSFSEEISNYEAIIQLQDERIASLTEEIAMLEASTGILQDANALLTTSSQLLQAQIDRLDTQISANSGILGTIANGWNNLWGNGVDVKALKSQKADLEAQKKEIDDKITANNKGISDNERQTTLKTSTRNLFEASRATNQEHADALKEKLGPLEEKIANGEATLEEIEAAIKEANKKTGVQASDKDVRTAALAIMDAGSKANGAEAGDTINNGVSNYLNSAEDNNGECDTGILAEIYTAFGFSDEEALQRLGIIEAIANYEEIGINIGIADFATMSITDLDAVVEQAIIQDVIKATSTKIVGNIKGITSKKDQETLAKAQNSFVTSKDALDSYYNANEVDDLEVRSYLKLANNMNSNMNQGFVYDATKLQEMDSKAQSLLTSYQTKVNSSNGVAQDMDAQFLQEEAKTEDALNKAKAALGTEAENNNKLEECNIEFLSLKSGYNNAESDSEKISYTKLAKELREKIQRVQDSPDSKTPYIDGSLWITA